MTTITTNNGSIQRLIFDICSLDILKLERSSKGTTTNRAMNNTPKIIKTVNSSFSSCSQKRVMRLSSFITITIDTP
jgi:hypothetical protein